MAPLSSFEATAKVEDLEGFDSDFLKRAVVGLTKFLNDKKTDNLLDTRGETVILNFELAKIPPGVNVKPIAIDLQHPIYLHSDVNVCLITRDPQKKWKELMKAQWDSSNGMEMPKVIGLSKLRKNYATMASKRELLRSYDLFLCDVRIVEQMPRILGRTFIDSGKFPIGVQVKEKSFVSTLLPRLHQTFMRIRTGPSLSVRIGKSGDSHKHLYQNAISVLRVVSRYFNPSDEEVTASTSSLFRDNEIRAVHLTATNSPSLPVYIRASVSEAVEALLKMRKKMENSESEIDTAVESEVDSVVKLDKKKSTKKKSADIVGRKKRSSTTITSSKINDQAKKKVKSSSFM